MKKSWIFKALAAASIALSLMMANNEAHAFTIKDDGEYALVMNIKNSDEGATIDSSQSGKVLKFNFNEGEEKVKLYDLTNGITAFNGKNEFSGWALSSDSSEPAAKDTELSKNDFDSAGHHGDVSYDKGKNVYALFTGEEISEPYQLRLDASGGKINGQDCIFLSSKPDEFETIDLSKYVAEREGCTFCGWGYNNQIVTSIDKRYFSKENNLTIFALYKSLNFYGVDEEGRLNNTDLPEDQRPLSYVLTLNANGGKIDGKEFKQYDYLNYGKSNNAMPIFHYIPERKGCTFKGWKTKKDGSGTFCTLINWESWIATDSNEFERDTLIESRNVYKNITLYATWEGTPSESEATTFPTRKESEIEGSITFEEGKDENYTLDIKEVEVPENLANKNVKFMVDVNLLNNNSEIVEVNGIKMIIKIKLPEILKGYNHFQAVYIGRQGEIKETLPATLEDGYIVFETTHLSKYGIIATNKSNGGSGSSDEEKTENENKNQDESENKNNSETQDEGSKENTEGEKTSDGINPITGDGIACAVALFAAASLGIVAMPILNKKK